MSRRRSRRIASASTQAQAVIPGAILAEKLEIRVLMSSAFDITGLTAMRQDPTYSNINGHGIGIAVLDTGVYAENPDLISNFAAFYDAVENPISTPPDTNPLDAYDNDGHGTHVSGIAASSNPAIGVADDATLVDVRVIPDTGESVYNADPVDAGLQWVEENASTYNIKVVNMSLGDPGINLNYVPNLDQEGADIQVLESMGITVVSASGNSYAVYAPNPGASLPAVESTISAANSFSDNGVGQYDFSAYSGEEGDAWLAQQPSAYPDEFNATSQRSTLYNQLVAPGTDIYSTWNSPAQLHNTLSGTSMAAPFISGTVALMQQAAFQFGGTYLQPDEVLQILRNTATQISDPVNSGNYRAEVQADGTLGPNEPLPGTGLTYDRVNVYQAIQAVKSFVQGNTGVGSDLNNTFATATALTPLNGQTSDTIQANIGNDGSVYIGPNDVDLYQVTLQVEGDLTVSLSPVTNGTNFDPVLRFFDDTGTELYSDTGASGTYPSIATPIGQPLPTGTYYIGISSIGNQTYNPINGSNIAGGTGQGDYILHATINNPDPHGVPAVGDVLNLTSPVTLLPTASSGDVPSNYTTGIIGQEVGPNGDLVQFPNGDVHFYQVVAPDTGEVFVKAEADPTLDPGASILAGAFDSTYTAVGNEGSNFEFPVSIGQTYYIGVTTQANQDFDPVDPYDRATDSTPDTPFDLYVAFSNGDVNGTVAQATPTAAGAVITQAIGTDNGQPLLGAYNGNKDADFYAFTAPSAGVFEATVSGAGGFVPEMSLWNTTNGIGGVQRLADASQSNPQLYEQVTAGEVVFVSVTGQGNQDINGMSEGSGSGGQTGTYTLTSSMQPTSLLQTLSNNSISGATPTPLTLNTPITANLGLDGSLYVGPTDVDMYSFVAPATEEYQFATNTSQDNSAQTVLRLFDANGNQLAENQSGSATSTNSVIQYAMTAGQTYYIGVSGVGPDSLSYNAVNGANAGSGSMGPYSIEATDAGPYQRASSSVQGQRQTFTDASGHKITVNLTGPGTVELIFNSPNTDSDLSQIQVNGTDTASTLTITGSTPLGSVDVNGSLHALNGREDSLTGSMTVTGSLGSLNLAAATGGNSITIGSGGRLMGNVGTLTDESLISSEEIGNFTATNWTTSSSTRYQINAPFIQNLTVRGTLDEDIDAAEINRLNVGTLSSSAIRVSNSIGTLTANSTQNSEIFVSINPTLTSLPAATTDFASESGSIKSITVRGAFSNTQIAAWSVGNVTLDDIQTNNGGTPFGVTADTLNHFRGVPAGGKAIILSKLFAPYNPTSLGGDAVVRIVG